MQNRPVDETGENRPLNQSNTSHKVAKYGSQAILFAVGLGAGALYYGPAKVCADNITCGQWLTDAIGREPAVALFSLGGLDFAAINAFFSSKSVERYIQYMKKQDNNYQRVGKTAFILAYSGVQTMSVVLTTETTSSHLAEQAITVGGIVPGIFYGTVGLMEKDIPWMLSLIKKGMRRSYWGITSCFSEISEEDKIYRARMIHYANEHQKFLEKAEHNWRYIASHPNKINLDDIDKDPLKFLLQMEAEADAHPWLTKGVHQLAKLTGLAVSANHSAAFLVNTHNGFKGRVPHEALLWFITLLLNASITYSNTMVTMRGTNGVIENIGNLLRGKPANSLMFNLHPKRAAAAMLCCALLASISYTVENMIFEEEFPGPDVGARHGLRMSANAGMVFYHLVGMFHFFHIMTAMMTRNDREKFIFKLEAMAERLKTMTFEDFMKMVESNTPENNAELGIKALTHEEIIQFEDEIDDELKPDDNNPVQIQEVPATTTSSWCGWFKRDRGTAAEREPLLGRHRERIPSQPNSEVNSIRSDISDIEEESRFVY